jgi:hypothetical protein
MTLLNTEVKQPEPQAQVQTDAKLSQQNVDAKLSQQNYDPNISQKKIDSPEQNQQIKEPENAEDPNWKAFREARKKDRSEKEAAERKAAEKEQEVAALKAAMEAAFSAKSAPTPQAYNQYYGINQGYDQPEETEEQKIERKVNELLGKREEQYKKQQAETEQREYPKRLMKDFPDFGQICSQENLDYLDFHYPEISRPLQRLGEGYDKWHDTYHAVKKLIPNHSSAKKEAARADINANKPRSIASTVSSPTGGKVMESWQDVESRRAENWSRMQKTMKGV